MSMRQAILMRDCRRDAPRPGLRLPFMRQQFMYQAGPLGWQARQQIFEVSVGVVTIEPSALNQAHHCGTALARPERTGEQPVVAVMRSFTYAKK